jgi:hypothetical protein
MGKLSRFLICVFGAGLCLVALGAAFEYKLLKQAQLYKRTATRTTSARDLCFVCNGRLVSLMEKPVATVAG